MSVLETKILHSPMTNRWYVVTKFNRDGSAREKTDITETLDMILRPASERIEVLEEALRTITTAAQSWHDFHHGSRTIPCDEICEALPQARAALHPQSEPKEK
jgi:type IV secretory pathway ATPase VirB11/archaellum biosynthesis ATPase